jgi:NAD(P)H-hydrate epimerase
MTLPDWCSPLPDADTMRAIDRWAIEERQVPSLDLMERAGAGVAEAVEELAPNGLIAIVCGKGNNGGDGLVAARLLREAGREVRVLTVAPLSEFQGDAHANLLRLPGDPPVHVDFEWALSGAPPAQATGSVDPKASPQATGPVDPRAPLEGASVIVDALLGTGFAGRPRGNVAAAIGAIHSAAAIADIVGRDEPLVVSVDVPSGVDASTGAGVDTLWATATVTFHTAKPGLWIHPGKAHAGKVRVLDIGIPRGAPVDDVAIGLIGARVLNGLPRRGAASTKFSSGHVLVAGGSRGLTGAPRLSALAAMRAGAGYVTACVPASQQPIVASGGPPELMTRGLPDEDGAHSAAGVDAVLRAAERGGALALGPGLGRSPGACAFARELVQRAEVAIVLDADGLNAHAGRLGALRARKEATVLTPHAGELARLLECASADVECERLHHVRAAAELSHAVVVLKGDDTLIADPTGRVAVSPGGSPALATAGSGDVLTGVIAALLAQDLDPFRAAAAGVWVHAAAGRAAARRVGAAEGVIASDVIAALPAARAGESQSPAAKSRSRAEESQSWVEEGPR